MQVFSGLQGTRSIEVLAKPVNVGIDPKHEPVVVLEVGGYCGQR